jgi:hypothetical protein
MFKDKLYIISEDLREHHRSREEIFTSAVEERLNKALISYVDDISKSCEYLKGREETGVLRRMNKRI